MGNKTQETLEKKILTDLDMAGFPTEVIVSSRLEARKWMVYNGPLFEDADTGKQRELDIHALLIDYSMSKELAQSRGQDENKLISHLIVEVKKTNKPWVFFLNGHQAWPMVPPQNLKSAKNEFSRLLFDELREYGLSGHRYIKLKLHKSFHASFTSPLAPSPIYEALVKVSKALSFFRGRYGANGNAIHLFTPVIILDGNLFSAKIGSDENVELRTSGWLSVVFSSLDKRGFEEEQICDIVTKESFNEYIRLIEHDSHQIYKAWTSFNKPAR